MPAFAGDIFTVRLVLPIVLAPAVALNPTRTVLPDMRGLEGGLAGGLEIDRPTTETDPLAWSMGFDEFDTAAPTGCTRNATAKSAEKAWIFMVSPNCVDE